MELIVPSTPTEPDNGAHSGVGPPLMPDISALADERRPTGGRATATATDRDSVPFSAIPGRPGPLDDYETMLPSRTS